MERELERRLRIERGREEARDRDPVERRAEAWRGLGYGEGTSRALATRERERGEEYGTDAEAHRELGSERDALYRDRWALRGEREGHGRLEAAAEAYRDASGAIERSSRLGRLLSADARTEYERAERALRWSGRELRTAGVEDPDEVRRRGEGLSGREEAQRGREEAWKPLEGAWRELGEVMGQRREAERQAERERGWEREDRERGDAPGTARARGEADRRREYDR